MQETRKQSLKQSVELALCDDTELEIPFRFKDFWLSEEECWWTRDVGGISYDAAY